MVKSSKFKINIAILILVLFALSTNTSAFYKPVETLSGDLENANNIAKNIDVFTPIISENKPIESDTSKEVVFAPKPEIIDTKTRTEIDEENARIENERLLAEAKAKRAVVTRERTRVRTITTANIESDSSNAPSSNFEAPGERDGNTYSYGYCTWYVANKRTDIPNRWGNARAWLGSAQSIGWPTGNEPKVGAIMVTNESWAGHVAYVENIDGNTVTISEMNFIGWGRASTRTLDINDPVIRGYIY